MSIAFSVSFGHIMKWSQQRKANTLWVGAANYIAASLTCAGLALVVLHPTGTVPFTITVGLLGGVCYLVSLLYYFTVVTRLGVGLATSAIRLSVALPVAVALLVWHEPLHVGQAIGLALVAIALPLLGRGQTASSKSQGGMLVGVLVPLFVINGLGQLAARIFTSGAPQSNTFLYLACLFGGAAISALVILARYRMAPRRQDLSLGLLLGAVNLSSNLCLLEALRELPSAVVFTVSSSAGVVVAAVTGVLFWREHLTRPATAGVALAAVAVVLLVR
ncbi:MAG TPA: SMR family transporter [Chloroflexota bacterium]|nr:SMR family transporter [Chloroflexota bacterium]